MTKYRFKKLVKEKINNVVCTYLLDGESESSKLRNLHTWKLQDYLITDRLSLSEKQLLYQLRVRMVEFKNNFKSKYGNNLDCSLCGGHIEDQEGQLSCPEIVSEVDTEHVRYNDIFENLDKQVVAIKV